MLLKSQFGMFQYLPDSLVGLKQWTVLLLFLGTDIGMECFRQRALRDFPALYVVPTISALMLTGSVVLGGVCFGEFDVLQGGEGAGLAGSIVVCMCGVGVMSFGGGREVEEEASHTGGAVSMPK